MEAWGWCAAEKSKKGIKNVDHMMWISHDIATVREFMFCKVRVWKGYFWNWLRKNWPTLTSSPTELPQNIESPRFVPPFTLLEFQKKCPPLTCFVWNLAPPPPPPDPLQRMREGNYGNTMFLVTRQKPKRVVGRSFSVKLYVTDNCVIFSMSI